MRLQFSTNPNGKLFADTFSDLRLHDAERFQVGAVVEPYYKGMQMGTARIVALRTIEYRHISDVLAYLVCGKPAPYLAALMRSFYESQQAIEPHTRFDHLVLQWHSRNHEAHAWHLKEWWQEVQNRQYNTQSL